MTEPITSKLVYLVSGSVGGVEYGRTSLSNSISPTDSFEISLVHYNKYDRDTNKIRAENDLFLMKNLRWPYLLDGYHVYTDGSSCKLLVKRFVTVTTWVDEVHRIYSEKPEEEEMSWFKFIDSKFKFRDIFRDICNGLKYLFKVGRCQGDLLKCAVVTRVEKGEGGEHGKILMATQKFDRRELTSAQVAELAVEDINNLWRLMVGVIGRDLKPNSMSPECNLSDIIPTLESHLPRDLFLFLNRLGHFHELSGKHFAEYNWVLDDPYFWDEEDRNCFMRKVWHLHEIQGFHITYFFNAIADPLPKYFNPTYPNGWRMLLRENQGLISILSHGSQKFLEGNIPKRLVVGVAKVYRDGCEHYNRGKKEYELKENDVKFSQLMQTTLNFPCAELRDFLTSFLWDRPTGIRGGFKLNSYAITFLDSSKEY